MTATRSEIESASSWSCVTYSVVIPSSSWMRRISSRSWTRTFASSAESGSSSSSTRGSIASARASATRCCMPPESWCGIALGRVAEPDELEQLADALALRSAFAWRRIRRPNSTFCSRRHVREQAVGLEDHSHVALVGRRPRDVLAVDDDAAGVGLVEAGDEAQRSRLAAPGRAEQRDELARLRARGRSRAAPSPGRRRGRAAGARRAPSATAPDAHGALAAALRPTRRSDSIAAQVIPKLISVAAAAGIGL